MADSFDDEDLVRKRWGLINLARLSGVALVVIGILGLREVWDYPEPAAWLLLALGLLGIFVVPRILARKWRTPRP
jgi:hypothetical protein